jgi:hypothetical protein
VRVVSRVPVAIDRRSSSAAALHRPPALSTTRGDGYAAEGVESDDDGVEVSTVVPVSETTCEPIASEERTAVIGGIGRDAPDGTTAPTSSAGRSRVSSTYWCRSGATDPGR